MTLCYKYCLNVIPRSFNELVIWYCDHCKPTLQKKVTSPGSHKKEAVSSGHHEKKEKKEPDIALLTEEKKEVICHNIPKKRKKLTAGLVMKKEYVSQLPNFGNNIQENHFRLEQLTMDPIQYEENSSLKV
ncbi:hypothetical protein L2E82_44827 [Cichorium intybus]|uniref:Uncharacterized protein n=1 Tax=Cichorium intybus TaxID=13427 RepID=A0ACB8ZR71_CICIN|nr:hypothetical protein L2E82_44827 [Cichorium intybus]